MSDWEEIHRLQADFQHVQLAGTKQKLSERNVIEIVSKLVELKLLDVIYTVDGKEYLTHQEVGKEIREELFVHGGRINLVELAQILNIDFSHVESKVNDVLKHDRNLTLVLGQLIDKSYIDRLAEEINDKLQDKGHVTIPELTKLYDLPAEFLSENLHTRLGDIIKGQVDSYDKDVIFTDAFIACMRSQIRGAFSAVTRPILVGSLIQQYKFQERIFFSIIEELISSKRLCGTLSGGRQEKATYIPDIYTKSQNEWVDSFYKQNGYLEYDSLLRLGITDPKTFIKKRYKSEPIIYLSTCCAGRGIQDQIEASVDEALSSGNWVDIMPLLPSIFSASDANHLLTGCLKSHPGAMLCCDTIIASDKLISQCSIPFPDLMAKKAEHDAKTHPAFRLGPGAGDSKQSTPDVGGHTKEDRKDQRRKKAVGGSGSTGQSGSSGAGSQGREVKTKAVKKKGYNKGRDNDSDDESTAPKPKSRSTEIEFMNMEEIEEVLRKNKSLEDCPDELVTEIAQQLIRPLTKQYQEVAKSIFLQSSGAATGSARKKTHGELQEKVTGLWTNARLFEKGLKMFTSEDFQANLSRHLLRTVCTDITNLVLNAVATDHMMSVNDEQNITNESRGKIITKLPADVQGPLMKLHTSLNGKTLDDFFTQLEVICGPAHLGLLLRKPDKKKEKQLTFSHRMALCEQITDEKDAAMTLHLASVILFHKFTQNIIHVPGKCVPQVVMFLSVHLAPEAFQELTLLQANLLLSNELVPGYKQSHNNVCQSLIHQLKDGKFTVLGNLRDLVIAQLQRQQSDNNEENKEIPNMDENIKKVKDIALTTKKSAQVSTSED